MIVYGLLLLVTAAVSYTLGSMSTIVLASNFVFHYNLWRLGRGNDWLSNFKRVYGLKGVLLLFLVEAIKDCIPIVIGGLLLGIKGHPETGRTFAGFCLVMGGLWPVFYNLRGGHAVMPLVFTGLFADPSLGVAIAVVFLGVVLLSKYTGLASCAAALAAALASLLIINDRISIILFAVIALVMIVKHIPSLSRITKGREERLSFKEDLSYKFDDKFV